MGQHDVLLKWKYAQISTLKWTLTYNDFNKTVKCIAKKKGSPSLSCKTAALLQTLAAVCNVCVSLWNNPLSFPPKNHVLHEWPDHQSITSDKQLIVLAQRDRAEREHRVVIVVIIGDIKKIMISLLCKWQLKDTKRCRRCPCVSWLVLIGTHPAAKLPLASDTHLSKWDREEGEQIWHYALNQLCIAEKVISPQPGSEHIGDQTTFWGLSKTFEPTPHILSWTLINDGDGGQSAAVCGSQWASLVLL